MADEQTSRLINRGNNLAIVVFLSAIAIGVVAELFIEKDWPDKIDDSLIIILAIILIVWYFYRNHKYMRSFIPSLTIILALVVKFGALVIEFDDKDAVGDEFGIIPAVILVAIISIILYASSKRKRTG